MRAFSQKNWVFISGLLGAIAVTLQQFIEPSNSDVQTKAIIFAVAMSILAYIANKWAGQGVSVTGIIGVLAATFVTINQTGTFSWNQFILQSVVAVLALVSGPPKTLK